jgi:hypothetical protein
MLPRMVSSYIVRIYREERNNPRDFVGTVEEVGAGEKRAFTCLDELWAILNPPACREEEAKTEKRRH